MTTSMIDQIQQKARRQHRRIFGGAIVLLAALEPSPKIFRLYWGSWPPTEHLLSIRIEDQVLFVAQRFRS